MLTRNARCLLGLAVAIFLSPVVVQQARADIIVQYQGSSFGGSAGTNQLLAKVTVGASDVNIGGFGVYGQPTVETTLKFIIFDTTQLLSPVFLSDPVTVPGNPGSPIASFAQWYDSPVLDFTLLANHTYAMGVTAKTNAVGNFYLGHDYFPFGGNPTVTGGGLTLSPGDYIVLDAVTNPRLFSSSADTRMHDALRISEQVVPTGVVTGTVNLQGWGGAKLGESVAVTLTDASSNSETLNTTLDSNGGYSVTTTLRGTCYVSAKCSHWLSDGKEAVVDANGAAAIDFSMINGDCNNDNGVDEGDFGLLSSAWYSSDGDPNFDARADLNGDGGVDEGDFGLLSAAWYQSGK